MYRMSIKAETVRVYGDQVIGSVTHDADIMIAFMASGSKFYDFAISTDQAEDLILELAERINRNLENKYDESFPEEEE